MKTSSPLKSAWLITWEAAGEHARVNDEKKVVAVLNYRWTGRKVREFVEQLYASLEYSPSDKVRVARKSLDNPYPAQFGQAGGAPWLRETLQSVLDQTWPHIEIILVDDGSHDESVAVARSLLSRRIRIIEQANAGQSASENVAIAAAQGDYFEYLDADDLLAPDKIERQIRMLQETEPGCVASGEWGRFYDSPRDASFEPSALWRDLEPIDWLLTAWSEHLMMHGAARLVPRAVAERAGPWDERLSLIQIL